MRCSQVTMSIVHCQNKCSSKAMKTVTFYGVKCTKETKNHDIHCWCRILQVYNRRMSCISLVNAAPRSLYLSTLVHRMIRCCTSCGVPDVWSDLSRPAECGAAGIQGGEDAGGWAESLAVLAQSAAQRQTAHTRCRYVRGSVWRDLWCSHGLRSVDVLTRS